jgi:mono/diheme cytochrome c family protein
LFLQNCVQCHGEDGRGSPGRRTLPEIPDFTDSAWQRSRTDPELAISILNGKGRNMPPWWGRLSDMQAADLVLHVRSFGPARVVKAGTAPPPANATEYAKQLFQLQQQWDDLEKQLQSLPAAPTATTLATAPSVLSSPLIQAQGAPNSGAGRFFGQNCAGCHTIGGGPLTGPDLKNVTKRKDRAWLVEMLLDPKSKIHSGDPYALELLSKARGIVMPNIFGMTRERAEAMLDFLDAQSRLDKSWYSEIPISDRKLTSADVERGRDLFTGRKPLSNGGAACIMCHNADRAGAEGGRLGPDLTKVYERVGGRTPLEARLWTPVTHPMLAIYQTHALQEDDVLPLVAFLQESSGQGVEQTPAPPMKLLLFGMGGAVLGLTVIGMVWGRLAPGGETKSD